MATFQRWMSVFDHFTPSWGHIVEFRFNHRQKSQIPLEEEPLNFALQIAAGLASADQECEEHGLLDHLQHCDQPGRDNPSG